MIVLLTILFPLIFVLSASFSDPIAVGTGQVLLWPVGFTTKAYTTIFDYQAIWVGYMNSIYYAVVGTFVNIVLTILAAYPLSRKDLFGKNVLLFLFVFTMFFNGGLIPFYLTVNQLGLYNNRLALIIPSALSVWNMMIAITYFRTSIPVELLEAAQLDGCNDFQFLWRIVVPLSAPLIAVLSLFYAVSHWNEFFRALIFLSNKELFPLQLILRDILTNSTIDINMLKDAATISERQGLQELLKYALIVVASVPVLLLYPFVQKHFVKGMLLGGIKG
jgi:multiple sugar transport system permease protein/putative aldouronate transport system permease protein